MDRTLAFIPGRRQKTGRNVAAAWHGQERPGRSVLGRTVRMVLFSARGERAPSGWHWVHLDQAILFMDRYLRDHREAFTGVDLKDPALACLALLQKCGRQLVQEDAA